MSVTSHDALAFVASLSFRKRQATSSSWSFWQPPHRTVGHLSSSSLDSHSHSDSSVSLSSSSSSSSSSSFDRLKGLDERLEKLERTAPSTLAAFYEPHLHSFSLRPGKVERLSVTSTLFALQTIFTSTPDPSSLYEATFDFNLIKPTSTTSSSSSMQIPLRSVLQAVLLAEWREDDLFQIPLLLGTVLAVDKERTFLGTKNMNEELADRLRRIISAVLAARPLRRDGQNQQYSSYITYMIARALWELQTSTPFKMPSGGGGMDTRYTPDFPKEDDDDQDDQDEQDLDTGSVDRESLGIGGLPERALPEGAASQLYLALARCAEVSYVEVCQQLAYRVAGDTTSFDIMKLAYSLLTYITATRGLEGTAGREAIPGQGPAPGSVVEPLNRKVVAAALDAFFAEQTKDGLWDKGQPIYKSFRRVGRNVGNAFVFAVDTLGSLLEVLPPEDFRPHVNALERSLAWIESHWTVHVIADYCDPESGQCYGKALHGWTSPHLSPSTGPQAWSTAQTLTCVSRQRRVVRQLMKKNVLEEFGGIAAGSSSSSSAAVLKWERLLDTDLGDPTQQPHGGRTLKSVLDERMIQPFLEKGGLVGAAYSAILFGPPGTAKTTICEALADKLGWDFLVIDTAAFLADGLSNVASRMRYVFERLVALEKCVILLDEMEEFCLDRESPGLGMESRMLTTAMLTAINDLRRAKRCIFFLATNRLRALDSAMTRPGRFDLQLFVGTPNVAARVTQFRNLVASKGATNDETNQEAVVETFRSYLQSVWTENAMFMNFLEGLQFAKACADIVASGTPLTKEAMDAILETQAAVMTVRGPLREEYVASMGLSRL